MTTLWITLNEAYELAIQADGTLTGERLAGLLERGEIQARARHLTLAEAQEKISGGFTVRIEKPRRKKLYLQPLKPQFWERAKADFSASSAVAKYGWGTTTARESYSHQMRITATW
jgi:hypothetical protein